jgi:hypothetical protein
MILTFVRTGGELCSIEESAVREPETQFQLSFPNTTGGLAQVPCHGATTDGGRHEQRLLDQRKRQSVGETRGTEAGGRRRPGVGRRSGDQLTVYDIDDARADLRGRGIDVSETFHDVTGVFHHAGTEGRLGGPAPEHADYGSFAAFSDPDGNGWLLQEIKTRLPGR